MATPDTTLPVIESFRLAIESESAGNLGIVLYTSFGVIRGYIRRATGNTFTGSEVDSRHLIKIDEATVEHYSSHLPTGSFSRLYVRLDDILGFAMGEQ